MSHTIWKFPLRLTNTQTLFLPVGAKCLSVALQGSVPSLWVLVNPQNPPALRTINIFGTGDTIEDPTILRFLGTVLMLDGPVFHFFEERISQ